MLNYLSLHQPALTRLRLKKIARWLFSHCATLFLHWTLLVENPKWISESIWASIRSIPRKKVISINSIKLNRLHSWQREEQERVAKQFCSITVSSDVAQTGCRWGWCGFLVGKCSLILCTFVCNQFSRFSAQKSWCQSRFCRFLAFVEAVAVTSGCGKGGNKISWTALLPDTRTSRAAYKFATYTLYVRSDASLVVVNITCA